MQTWSSDENSARLSVRPSVCLSVKHVLCDKMVEISVHIFISYERSFTSFLGRRMVAGGRILLPEILGQSTPVGKKLADFDPIARSASAVTHSEKSSVNANRKSTTRFQ